MDALEEFGQTFDERLTGIDDPAELVAAGFRLSARMADSHPELMQVLRRRGLGPPLLTPEDAREVSRRPLPDLD